MPDPSTTRLGMYKSKSDGSELVNYPQDIGGNLDKLDAAVGFQIVTSSTRPSTPYSGKAIAESDTGRLYYSNASIPASGSWVEIASNGASFTMTGTRAVTLNGTAGSTVKLATLVTGDSVNRLEVTADGTMNWSPGSGASDVGLARTSTNTLGTLSGDHFKVGGDLRLINGTTTFRNALSAATTVANTLTETNLATLVAPAADAVVGAVYKLTCWGRISTTGTPTFTLKSKIGSTVIATMYSAATGSALSNVPWSAELEVAIVSTGAGGTFAPVSRSLNNFAVAGTTAVTLHVPTAGTAAIDTTVSNTFALSATWLTASASNTITCQGFTAVRIA